MKKPLNIVLIGRSGSGKGTQGKFLIKKFPYLYSVSTGELFRNLGESGSDAGKKVKIILETGGLPNDDLATTMWMHELAYNLREDDGLLADGFPRRLNEAKSLDGFLEFLNREDKVFYFFLDISKKEAKRRLLARGRSDDNELAVEGRMKYFEEKVVPVIEYYKKHNKLIKINGEQAPQKIHEEIMNHIGI